MSPISGYLSTDPDLPPPVQYRKPTLKTGRGHGRKKKQNLGLGFKLLETFKKYSYDKEIVYDQGLHEEKPYLVELQLSPRQRGINRGGKRDSVGVIGLHSKSTSRSRRGSRRTSVSYI